MHLYSHIHTKNKNIFWRVMEYNFTCRIMSKLSWHKLVHIIITSFLLCWGFPWPKLQCRFLTETRMHWFLTIFYKYFLANFCFRPGKLLSCSGAGVPQLTSLHPLVPISSKLFLHTQKLYSWTFFCRNDLDFNIWKNS